MRIRRQSLVPFICFVVCSLATCATAADRPNILFAIADDWSFGHAGAYDCGWVKTPGFDRVAREGLLFRRAYTPNAKCAPSRSCIITGRNSWQLKDAANHICFFPPEFTSYPEALAANGYFVGTTGKGWGPGIAKDGDGKLRQIVGKPYRRRNKQPPARAISGNDYAANFADFLSDAPQDQPWCFWYGAFEPHRPYEYGVGVSKSGKQLSDLDRVPGYWPDNDTIRNDMLDYAFEVEHFDTHLVRMLDQIAKAGQLDNTLVVVTSDHGMPFPRCKGQAYDDSNHVPLAIMWPAGIRHGGRKLEDYVSFVDLAPTFLEVAGIGWEQSRMKPSPGRSLVPLFGSSKSGQVDPSRDHVLIGKERHDIGRPNDEGYPIRGIVRDNLLYIRNYETDRWPAGNPETGYLNCDGSPTKSVILDLRRNDQRDRFWRLCFGKRPTEELYHVVQDPDCVQNLANDEGQASTRKQLREMLERRLREQGDPRMEGRGDFFDRVPYANAGTRNFYGRFMDGEKLRAGWVNPTDFEKAKLD